MKKRTFTTFMLFMLCILMILPSALAETREGVIWLEGQEEIIEETLFESPLGFSFWYANESLEVYQGEGDDAESVVVKTIYSDDYMVLSMITKEDAEEYFKNIEVTAEEEPAVTEEPEKTCVQTEIYLELNNGQYSFCVIISENGHYLRAVGQYSVEAAEGNAKYFQRVLDNVTFTED